MKPKTIGIVLALFVACSFIGYAQNTFHVSPSGNDVSGRGTAVSPWRTIGKAVSTARDGDAIIVLGGKRSMTYEETVTIEKQLTILASPLSGLTISVRKLIVKNDRTEIIGFTPTTVIERSGNIHQQNPDRK